MNLQGARILVTGGSKGLGKATAKMLTEAGAKVAITARHKEELEKVAKEIGALAIQADSSKMEDIQKVYQTIEKEWGGLDVLVNNAGIGGGFKPLEELTIEDFRKVYDVNVFGFAMMAKEAVKLFKKEGKGHLVTLASTAALKGFANGSVYSSSKFAVRSMSQCWQAELRPHNIRVIQINPSEVPTAFGTSDGQEKPEEPQKLSSEEIAHAIKSALEMDDRGFIPELTVFATNPFKK